MIHAITVENASKTFHYPSIPKHTTLKETIVKAYAARGRTAHRRVKALSEITFNVGFGQMLGVIGRNGSGKTTLLRLLAGIYPPDQGSISVAGTMAPLLALGTGFHPDLTGRENARIELLVLGLKPSEIHMRMEGIIDFSGICEFIDAPMRTYSSGMSMRLAFAVAVSVDPDILLLDEVLAVGDEMFARKCLQSIEGFRRRGKTIVLVSHNADIIERWCDVALWLDRGAMRMIADPKAVIAAYRGSDAEPGAGSVS